jgi:hypothetical protein
MPLRELVIDLKELKFRLLLRLRDPSVAKLLRDDICIEIVYNIVKGKC